jgi:anionic cell wall polymer biosynthesis LytR-Cps2A-Psr (LCP) family protein
MTDPLAEQNKYLENKKGTDYLTEGGDGVLLNGNQALAYARLRYVGNADFERTQRQRTVITKIIAKAKTLSPLALDNFLKVSASEITTNMSKAEMYLMFYKLLFSMNYEMNQLRIPQEGAYYYGQHDGQSTLDLDFDACIDEIKKNVYN